MGKFSFGMIVHYLALFAAMGWMDSKAAFANHDGPSKIHLVVSVDWEGDDIRSENLREMSNFRSEFPQVSLIQFMNAAYFTKPNANPSYLRRQIGSVIRPGDELGLHIHGWKTLFESAGVAFRSKPTIWGKPISDCSIDCGHEVAINAYTAEELQRVVHFSKEVLSKNGLGNAVSFRSGAWMGSPNVLQAIAAEGITMDSSEVPAELLRSEVGGSPLYRWVLSLWRNATPTSQPEVLDTAAGPIWELPDNGALADYMSASEMVDAFRENVELWKADPSKDVYFQIGFHQETASRYLPRVREAIRQISALSQREGIPLEFASLPLKLEQ